jgi:outer membrane protein OmpA-like peptidoglycan-associated protein
VEPCLKVLNGRIQMSLRRFVYGLLISAVLLFTPSTLCAQHEAAPDFEIFGGYSWYHAGGSVSLPPTEVQTDRGVGDFQKGWGTQVTVNLTNVVGITMDGSGHYEDGDAYTIAGGPRFKLRRGRFMPFAEVLAGIGHFVPDSLPEQDHFALITGLGIDYKLTPHLAFRPIQADYVFTSYNAINPSQRNTLNGVRLQAGFVLSLGLPKEEGPVSATCSAQPSSVDSGMPVTVAVTPSGFSPNRTLSYSYMSTGGKVSGNTSSTSVDTSGLAAGSYTVSATIMDNGKGKHQRTASCQATFAVNAMHPPTISVTANPDTVTVGEPSTITANGSSPDNRPLTYNCNASAGTLNGSESRYTLNTTGVAPGNIDVNCTDTDDRNLSASGSTSVRVNAPAPPPQAPPPPPQAVEQPQANKFGDIEFKHDLKRPTRVDNEAKGELDRYADALNAAPDSKGVVVGFATEKEQKSKNGKDFAAQRAINTKAYLTQEKGIDPARIEPRVGSGDDQRVDLWIVPAGAQFPQEDTVQVDEGHVKAVPRLAPMTPKAHRKMRKAE